jgi:ABC-2 type transport system ATP-binding protein
VLVSSHVLSEVEQTVDDVVVIHRGRLVKEGPTASLTMGRGVRVRSPQIAALTAVLQAEGGKVDPQAGELLSVRELTPAQVGDAAWRAGIGGDAAHAPVHGPRDHHDGSG